MLIYIIIKGFLFFLSLIAINEIVAQIYNETIPFVEPSGKFSIYYPSNWNAIAPGHSFEEGNLDLIIQKPDRQQGYIEIRHEEITSDAKKTNYEKELESETSLYNKSLEIILPLSFKDYVSKLSLENVKHIEEYNYDVYLISGLKTGSILYSFVKDDKLHNGLYIISKIDYNIIYISYTASTNYFDKSLPEAQKIINSIKFNKTL